MRTYKYWGALKLSVEYDTSTSATIECMLFIMDWERWIPPQFSFVPVQAYAKEIDLMSSDIIAPELDCSTLLHALAKQKIPRTTRAVMECVPVKAGKKPQKPFVVLKITSSGDGGKWCMDITCQIIEADKVPVEQKSREWVERV